MKIFINVRINITNHGRMFTVWPRQHRFLPGIEFHTGFGESLSEAMAGLKDSLPDLFRIDDEYSVCSDTLEYAVIRPFDIVRSDIARIFILA